MPTADYNPNRINRYVPALTYHSEVNNATGLAVANLGAPAAASATAISSGIQMVNGSAVTVNYGANSGILDAKYGRCIDFVASSTNTRGVTITGVDYLGQPIQETLTLTSATAVSTVKAYKKVNRIVFASASDTTTVNVGYNTTLGLPFAAKNILEEKVSGVILPPSANRKIAIPFFINQTDLLAPTAQNLIAPFRGYVTGIHTIVQVAITTGGTITAHVGTNATTAQVTIANSDAVGTQKDSTIAFTAAGLVAANGRLRAVPASFATAGAVNGHIDLQAASLVAYNTATQTATTADPRGTYQPESTPDGTKTYELVLSVDMTNMYGNAHFGG